MSIATIAVVRDGGDGNVWPLIAGQLFATRIDIKYGTAAASRALLTQWKTQHATHGKNPPALSNHSELAEVIY
ncbi:MAG: hypothetical protein ACRYF2_01905 [Janthinobacterium lividum]